MNMTATIRGYSDRLNVTLPNKQAKDLGPLVLGGVKPGRGKTRELRLVQDPTARNTGTVLRGQNRRRYQYKTGVVPVGTFKATIRAEKDAVVLIFEVPEKGKSPFKSPTDVFG